MWKYAYSSFDSKCRQPSMNIHSRANWIAYSYLHWKLMGINETALHTNSFDYLLSTSYCFPAIFSSIYIAFCIWVKISHNIINAYQRYNSLFHTTSEEEGNRSQTKKKCISGHKYIRESVGEVFFWLWNVQNQCHFTKIKIVKMI